MRVSFDRATIKAQEACADAAGPIRTSRTSTLFIKMFNYRRNRQTVSLNLPYLKTVIKYSFLLIYNAGV